MTQNPYPGPGFHDVNQFQAGQPAPDAEAKLKRSQLVLLATAGAYLVYSLADYFLITMPIMQSSMDMLGSDAMGVDRFASVMIFVFLAVILGLFALVYFLVQKRLKAGRITGCVFAGFGILSATSNLYSNSQLLGVYGGAVVVLLAGLAWLILAILWIVFASHKSVTSILS